ncbi:myb/SANT-like DNA-binding domain-containing protein 3 [Periplaneta americana]|uniref:myb/SANT-like DNA-binding domain-containing protein 3 n=1 Tax=Periplaneta americana TaxID=6978 RepID=UPI0037E8CDA0
MILLRVVRIHRRRLNNDYVSSRIILASVMLDCRMFTAVAIYLQILEELTVAYKLCCGNKSKMEIGSGKRKRAGNWTQEEKNLLFTLIQKRIAIIDNKCTTTNTNARKEQAWKDIHKEFCARFGDGDRSILRLKEQWKRLKTNAKCNVQKQKEYTKTTDEGCPGDDVTLDDMKWDVVTSVSHELAKDDAEFDSDAQVQYELCEISMPSPSEGVTAIENISIPVSPTPISIVCAASPVSETPIECAVDVSTQIDNRQSYESQEESVRDDTISRRRRKDPVSKLLRMTEYEAEVLLLQKQKHEVELQRGEEMHTVQMQNMKAKMKQDEELHRAQMKRDDEIHELQKAKLLLEMEMLKKHS